MKTILLAVAAVAMLATPAAACFEAASYGVFTMGKLHWNNYSVGGDVIGSHHKVLSNGDWDFNGAVYVDQCSHLADFNTLNASGR